MYYYLIAPAKAFHQNEGLLTYESDTKLKAGQIVEIPLGKQTTIGIIIKTVNQPDFTTKAIMKVLYDEPLPKHLIKAILWLADYYRCPLSSVVQAALPRGITKKRRATASQSAHQTSTDENPLNTDQQRAIKQINSSKANTILLHGVTGSGKTNIYIELARQQLEQNQSVILLVPEIALTSQLVQNIRTHFENVILLHSELTESVHHQLW